MASVEHSIRNWLHQLVLALQAVHLPSLLNAMDEAHFEGLFLRDTGVAYTEWEALKQEATRRMGALTIGDLSLQVERPTIALTSPSEAAVEWEMGCFLGRHSTTLLPLHCVATLTNRSGAWKATRIEVEGIPANA